ncbi:MAG: glycosyltransferase [Winogradskyella sp.]|uniref:glycosyltransferase family 2 protein n=1 Tax=Winogradskyella sp. TaxID=1883156 RepID=UPI000F3F400B|nr:glycosyltransferase family 2 protein [Winogradskyella sp.]RNC86877.1 MAG: glycosyltransferase [Winogradskyella sp.]
MEVSVLMITYNHEAYITEAINGVINQITDFDFELVIADDNSPDNTEHIVNSIQNSSNKLDIRYYKNKTNLGMVKNFESAYFKTTGNYIAICEGDDFWTDSYKLQKQVDFLKENRAFSFCYTRFKVYSQTNKTYKEDFNGKHFSDEISYVPFDYKLFYRGWHIGNQTLVFRKTDFDEQSFNKFNNFKDVHLISQLLKVNPGACLNFFGAVYRQHDGGIHTTVSEYNGYKIGYLTHKEIYLDNKANIYLRLKYLHSYKNFVNVNIRTGHLTKAFWMTFDLFFKDWKFLDFLRHIKRILVKLVGNK